MTIDLYSIEELNSIGDAAIKTNLPGLDPALPGSFVRSLVSANSILVFAAQRNIEAAQKDFFPQTASGEFLDFWAGINALTRVPGTVAEGNISIAGTLAVAIPLGSLFVSSVNESYESVSAVSIASHTGSVTLTRSTTTATAVTLVPHGLVSGLLVTITGSVAPFNVVDVAVVVLDENTFTYSVLDSGSSSDSGSYASTFADVPVRSVGIGVDKNLGAGALLSIQSTIVGLATGTGAAANRDGLTAGADIEDDESLRERVLLANSIDPGVFTSAQIRLDALTIPTATRVFVTNPVIAYTTDGVAVASRVITGNRAGSTVTATPAAGDTSNLFVGSTITIAGGSTGGDNGEFVITEVTAGVTFKYTSSGAAGAIPGSPTVSLDIRQNIPWPGIVFVFVLDDNNASSLPSSTTLTNVKSKIIEKLPAHTSADNVVVVAPIPVEIDITITGLTLDSSAMRSAVEANLLAFFQDSAGFTDDITTNQLIAVIQNTQDLETGVFVEDFTLTLPAADVAVGNGSIAVKGTVTFA